MLLSLPASFAGTFSILLLRHFFRKARQCLPVRRCAGAAPASCPWREAVRSGCEKPIDCLSIPCNVKFGKRFRTCVIRSVSNAPPYNGPQRIAQPHRMAERGSQRVTRDTAPKGGNIWRPGPLLTSTASRHRRHAPSAVGPRHRSRVGIAGTTRRTGRP
jgi:hypothetical protein